MSKANKTPGAMGAATEGYVEVSSDEPTGKQPTRQQKWRRRHPLKYLAHLYLHNAVKLGVINRAPCEVCGSEKAEGHHPNYREPLRVVWLCRRHHAQLHAKQKGRAA